MLLNSAINTEQRRVIYLSALGGLLEFYDFTIYGLFAVYFSSQFFPSDNQFISIIASYAVFVVGYIARPIGGIIFSQIGDTIGRKKVLILTMILMGISSLGMGLLPTYAQIGVAAPLLMLLFRLIQGLAIGGELPSTIVYVSESIPNNRGIGLGAVFAGVVSGLIPGMIINLVINHTLTTEQINSYGWRIPFIIGGLLCFVAYQVRGRLHETKAFKDMKDHKSFTFFLLIKDHLSKVLIGTSLVAIMATPIILLIIFMPTYLTKIIKLDHNLVSDVIFAITFISLLFIYLGGRLTDTISVYKIFTTGLIGILISAGICYYLISSNGNLYLALGLFAIFQGLLVSLPPIILSHIFPLEVRLNGVALSYNLAFVIFGGLTPIIVTYLIEKTGNLYYPPVLFLAFTVVVSSLGLIASKKYYK